jgi:hypothetical protein
MRKYLLSLILTVSSTTAFATDFVFSVDRRPSDGEFTELRIAKTGNLDVEGIHYDLYSTILNTSYLDQRTGQQINNSRIIGRDSTCRISYSNTLDNIEEIICGIGVTHIGGGLNYQTKILQVKKNSKGTFKVFISISSYDATKEKIIEDIEEIADGLMSK